MLKGGGECQNVGVSARRWAQVLKGGVRSEDGGECWKVGASAGRWVQVLEGRCEC